MRIDNPIGLQAALTGSFSGSFAGDGSSLTGVGSSGIFAKTGSSYNTTNDLEITGSLIITNGVSGSFSGSFFGDGSGLSGVGGGGGGSITAPFFSDETTYRTQEFTSVYLDGATSQGQRYMYLDAAYEGAVAYIQIPDSATYIDALYVWGWRVATGGPMDFSVHCIAHDEQAYSNASISEDVAASTWHSNVSAGGQGDLYRYDISSMLSGIWAAGDLLHVIVQYPGSGGSSVWYGLVATLEWS